MGVVLGKLERVLDVRQVWQHEAQDFTPWLAENLQILGDTIGTMLELEAQEKGVGPFKADILAKDMLSGNWVLIENQLDKTDHCHLGQLITYAAGLKAVTIVWVANAFTDEHRAALDWLNEITDEDVHFFGLQIELWSIGELIAPKLTLICQPNTWTKRVTIGAKQVEGQVPLSGTRQRILQILQEHYPQSLSPTAIMEILECPIASVHVTLRRMLADGQVVSLTRGLYTFSK